MILAVLIYFSIGWACAYKTNKYSWIDFFWSSSFILLTFYLFTTNTDHSLPVYILSSMIMIWSFRLSSHLFVRIKKHSEDSRYLPLIKRWGPKTPLYFYLVFIGQGLLNLILILPLYYTYKHGVNDLSILQIFSIIVFIDSIILEAIADNQLKKFISKKENKGLVCKVGLWKYSRHPNYFFESMIWLSFSLFSLSYSPVAIVPYIIMLILLRFVTGVPPAEASSLNSKPEKFKIYQKETNIFIPMPKNKIN